MNNDSENKENPSTETRSLKILTDDIEANPGFGFDKYSDTISSIVMGSDPKFTIGIYGEWGTGKTTLMNAIQKKIENANNSEAKIIPVWFNAWRYEREENQATIPLLKTIAYTLENYPVFKPTSDKIKRALWAGAKEIASKIIAKHLADVDFDKIKEDYKGQIDKFPDVEKDTIFYDGMEQIKQEIVKIRNRDPTYRIVVFVDDLDRCSPKKALEVLESIKIFTDIEGFVYVMGISHETIYKLVSHEYKDIGIQGKHYLSKIIQFELAIPSWTPKDLEEVIEMQIIPNIDKRHSDTIFKNKALISSAIENNPRELKRLINNIIVALDLSEEIVDKKSVIIAESLKMRWGGFYPLFSTEPDFRKYVIKILGETNEKRKEILQLLDIPKSEINPERISSVDEEWLEIDEDYQTEIKNMDNELWKYLKQFEDTDILGKIDWKSVTEETVVLGETIAIQEQESYSQITMSFNEKSNICLNMLNNPNFKFRTSDSLKKTSGMSDEEFKKFLLINPQVIKSRIPDKFGRDLYTLRNKR